MCEPATAALAVTAVAGGLSAYSQIQTGRANAALANANADAQEQAARDTINTANDQHTSSGSRPGGLPDSKPMHWLLTAPN